MTQVIVGILSCMLFLPPAQKSKSQLRDMYFKSSQSRSLADDYLSSVSGISESAEAEMLAYKGLAHIIQAKYKSGGIQKLKSFKEGKRLLEMAVAKDPSNVEVRFLRFTVQSNVPGVLNYSDDLGSDKKKVLDGYSSLHDDALKKYIRDFMNNCDKVSESERQKLKP